MTGASGSNASKQRTLRISAKVGAIASEDLSVCLERTPSKATFAMSPGRFSSSICSKQDARKKKRCGVGPLLVFAEMKGKGTDGAYFEENKQQHLKEHVDREEYGFLGGSAK